MGEARQKQPKPGDCEIGDRQCSIECTRLLEWYSMNFDAVNNAVTIVFAQQEPSKIGRNCLTIAMVNPAAPGGKLDVSRLWSPNRRAKMKSPRHLKQH